MADFTEQLKECLVSLCDVRVPRVERVLSALIGGTEWNEDTAYAKGSTVWLEEGGVYEAKANTDPGCHPSNIFYWKKIGDYKDLPERLTLLDLEFRALQEVVDKLSENLLTDEIKKYIEDMMGMSFDELRALIELLQRNQQELSAQFHLEVQRIDNDLLYWAEISRESSAKIVEVDGRLTAVATDILTLNARLNGDEFASSASLVQMSQTLANDIQAVSQTVTALNTEFNGNIADIRTELKTVSDATTAMASRTTQLESRMPEEGGKVVSEAKLSQVQQTLVSKDTALASELTILNATVGQNHAAVQQQMVTFATENSATAQIAQSLTARVGTTESSLSTLSSAMASTEQAVTQQFQTVQASVDNNNALLNQEIIARVTGQESIVTQMEELLVEYENRFTSYRQATAPTSPRIGDVWYDTSRDRRAFRWNGTTWQEIDDGRVAVNAAGIISERQARISADQGLAAEDVKIYARVAASEASISTNKQAQVDGDSANATAIQRVDTKVGNVEASIVTTNTVVNDLKTGLALESSMVLQTITGGVRKWAGYKVGLGGQGQNITSSFYISADDFRILPQGTTSAGNVNPFEVVNNVVRIRSALIGDATIDFAKITDSVQSVNYVAGVSGWKLWKNGTFEINGAVAGQGKMIITNDRIWIYDSANVVRVKLGKLR